MSSEQPDTSVKTGVNQRCSTHSDHSSSTLNASAGNRDSGHLTTPETALQQHKIPEISSNMVHRNNEPRADMDANFNVQQAPTLQASHQVYQRHESQETPIKSSNSELYFPQEHNLQQSTTQNISQSTLASGQVHFATPLQTRLPEGQYHVPFTGYQSTQIPLDITGRPYIEGTQPQIAHVRASNVPILQPSRSPEVAAQIEDKAPGLSPPSGVEYNYYIPQTGYIQSQNIHQPMIMPTSPQVGAAISQPPPLLTQEWAQQMNQMMAVQLEENHRLRMTLEQMTRQFEALGPQMQAGQVAVTDHSSGVYSKTETTSVGGGSSSGRTGVTNDGRSIASGNHLPNGPSSMVDRVMQYPPDQSQTDSPSGPQDQMQPGYYQSSHFVGQNLLQNGPLPSGIPQQQFTADEKINKYFQGMESVSVDNMSLEERDNVQWLNAEEKMEKHFRESRPLASYGDDESTIDSIRTSTTGSGQSKSHRRKKEQLIHDARKVHQKLRDGVVGKRLNILLLGMPGVGKSSLVNSRGYKEISLRGSYGAGGRDGRSAVTLTIKGLPLFSPALFQDSAELKYACQLVFYDCPGLPDTDDKNVSSIIRLILDGKMKERTNVSDLLRVSEKEIKKKFSRTEKSREIHVVLVVHAATDPVPEALLSSIRDSLSPEETGGRAVPMLAVITKTDQLPSLSDLDEIEQTIAGELGMTGATERIICSKLYCNEVTPGLKRDEEIDANMCRIWDYILRPELVNTRQRVSRISSILKR